RVVTEIETSLAPGLGLANPVAVEPGQPAFDRTRQRSRGRDGALAKHRQEQKRGGTSAVTCGDQNGSLECLQRVQQAPLPIRQAHVLPMNVAVHAKADVATRTAKDLKLIGTPIELSELDESRELQLVA